VTLHDLVADMGKEIVRQESPEDPRKHSRLWAFGDIIGELIMIWTIWLFIFNLG